MAIKLITLNYYRYYLAHSVLSPAFLYCFLLNILAIVLPFFLQFSEREFYTIPEIYYE